MRFHIDDENRWLVILTASTYSDVPADVVSDLVLDYDWPNAEDHQAWLNTAPINDIVSWLEALCRDDPEGIVRAYEEALAERYGRDWRTREDDE